MTRRKRDGAAFSHAGGDTGILLLHGFSGTPFEMREIGERMRVRGYGLHAPTLPGHSGDLRALARVSVEDYFIAAERALDEAERNWKRVYVVGNSLGGALALHLAQRRNPAAVVTINTPVAMPPHVHRITRVLSSVSGNVPVPVNMSALVRRVVGYPLVPIVAVQTFLGVIARVHAGLRYVRTPLLVLHSGRDATVPSSNAATIAGAVGSRDRRAVVLPHGAHLMTVGRWLDVIDAPIAEFLARMDRGAVRDDRTTAGPSAVPQ